MNMSSGVVTRSASQGLNKKEQEKGTSNGKIPAAQGSLLTPDPTPEVESERAAADKARLVKNEIDRVIKCTSAAEILSLEDKASLEDKFDSFRRLGCLIHPKVCKEQGAEDAFKKVLKAAEDEGVAESDIGLVQNWNGEEDLNPDDDPGSDSESGSQITPEDLPAPPDTVKELYKSATPLLHSLCRDVDNKTLLDQLAGFNNQIKKETVTFNSTMESERDKVNEDQWKISENFFLPHYREALRSYTVLETDTTNEEARRNLLEVKSTLDQYIQQHHLPETWSVVDPDTYLELRKPRKGDTGNVTATETTMHMEYPWPTALAADKSLIIGIRKIGNFGRQVCIETVEDGRLVRRLESASSVGLLQVEKYCNTAGHKNLAEGQRDWSNRERHDFEELLWVTKSQTKRKNTATRSKDPNADCCVRFKSKGICILTMSSFARVLGKTSARALVQEVCDRDNIDPPWEAGCESYYFSKAAIVKNSSQQRAIRDAQAQDNKALVKEDRQPPQGSGLSSTAPAPDTDDRLKKLEASMQDLFKAVEALASVMAK